MFLRRAANLPTPISRVSVCSTTYLPPSTRFQSSSSRVPLSPRSAEADIIIAIQFASRLANQAFCTCVLSRFSMSANHSRRPYHTRGHKQQAKTCSISVSVALRKARRHGQDEIVLRRPVTVRDGQSRCARISWPRCRTSSLEQAGRPDQ